MNKKIIVPTILFIAVIVLSLFAFSQEKGKNKINEIAEDQLPKQIVLFYGDGCPHCVIVEEYIEENNIQDKVSFNRKEVYYNKQNADELVSRAQDCDIPTDSIGVPFLWDGENCLIGDQDIINFFKEKTYEL